MRLVRILERAEYLRFPVHLSTFAFSSLRLHFFASTVSLNFPIDIYISYFYYELLEILLSCCLLVTLKSPICSSYTEFWLKFADLVIDGYF